VFKYITILFLFFSTFASADEHGYDFRWQHIPVICGDTPEILKYLEDNEFILQYVSVGREGSKTDGNPVYWVAFYLNEKGSESVSTATSPSGNETCILYRSFDLRSSKIQTSL
tara:strand:+ start:339 stop:677 length:339 start_codon:yes stop_codon:yes gene_type:complete